MRDPREGLTPEGYIATGASHARIAAVYAPMLEAAVAEMLGHDAAPSSELHLYGSVATGQAVVGRSDVDLLAVGVPADQAEEVGRELTTRFPGLCRSVDVAVARHQDFLLDGDAAYGLRVFLRHYCVPLGGPDDHRSPGPFRGDADAARGFNGDIADHLARWRAATPDGALGRRVARKTLLALAGLVSVHDATWTTDRAAAVARWVALRPERAASLQALLSWSEGTPASAPTVEEALSEGGVVGDIAAEFASRIGLWH